MTMDEHQQSTAELKASQFREFTYPYSDLHKDHCLDENLPTPPQCSISISPKFDIGSLDRLPLEILQHILSQVDLRTLEDFRRVNQRALQLVASVPEYKAIITHARDALRGVLSIETGRWITCETLYGKLCTAECEQCGDFGGYLYLLTCKRVCFLCFTARETYQPLEYGHAIQKFGLDPQIVDTLPQMRSIPGTYINQTRMRARFRLVDFNSARRAGIALHGSVEAMQTYVEKMRERAEGIWLRRALERRETTGFFDGPAFTPSIDVQSPAFRSMAIVHTLWLNPVSKEAESGRYCTGCEEYHHEFYRDKGNKYFRRQFTADLFDEHLRRCGKIKGRTHKKGPIKDTLLLRPH